MGSRVRDIASRLERAAGSEPVGESSGRRPAADEGASSTRGGPRRSSTFDPLGTTTSTRRAPGSTPTALGTNRRTSTLPVQRTSSPSSQPPALTAAAKPRELTRPSPTTPPSPHPLFRPSPPKIKTTDIRGPSSPARGSPLRSTSTAPAAVTTVAPRPAGPRTSLPSTTRDPPRPPMALPTAMTAPLSAPSPEPPSYKSFASSSTLPGSTGVSLNPPARTNQAGPLEHSAKVSSSTSIDGLPPISRGDHPLLAAPAVPFQPVEASTPLRVNVNIPSSSTTSSSTPPPSFSPSTFSPSTPTSTKKPPTSNPPSFRSRDSLASPSSSRPSPPAPSSTPHKPEDHPRYNPLPPAEVFSRSSLPLSIPHLDQYLASLSPPDFSPLRGAGVGGQVGSGLFPPFDLLATKGGLGGEAVAVPGEWIRRGTWNLVGKQRVKYAWARPKSLLDTVTNWALGAEGSNFMSSLYSLEGAYGAVQVLALVLGSVATLGNSEKINEGWRTLFLQKIPNILALNFPSVFGQSIAFLMVYQVLALLLLFFFRRVASSVGGEQDVREGFATMKWVGWTRSHRAGVMIMSFGLIVLYLPMSTMAVHAIIWTSDFWVIPNPYLLEDDPVSAQGVKFCYTTNLTSDSINFAPLIVATSIITLLCVTFYFPIKLWYVIRANLPRVDRWTELGRKRSRTEMEHEFQRVISRDENPLSFLYRGYRRRWGSYRAFYLLVKLVALLIVAIFSKDNCLFHTISRAKMDLIRQSVLVFFLGVFLTIQLVVHPFIDYRSNASEVVSRSTYLVMVVLALLVSLDVRGKNFFNTWALYFVYAISYGGNVWFSVVSWGWVQVLIQRIQKRIDFSIDIFSPHLDVSPSSAHIKRRVWQETISTLLLSSPSFRMPAEQKVVYSEPQGQKWPPYLVNFRGSVAERHVENLKILREVGTDEYNAGLARLEGPDGERYARVTGQILLHATGPDSYFRPATPPFPGGVTSFFGHAWLVPFPLTLVMRYDQSRDPLIITSLDTLELYLLQNTRPSIRRRRLLRMTIRSLEGQTLHWPHTTTSLVGKQSLLPRLFQRRPTQTSYDSLVTHTTCKLVLTRQGSVPFRGHDLGSGFEITLNYSHGVVASASAIGLSDDFELTTRLADFLKTNENAVGGRLPATLAMLDDYRSGMAREYEGKKAAMGWGFLRDVYERPMGVEEMRKVLERGGKGKRGGHEGGEEKVACLPRECERELRVAEARAKVIFRSPATALWYLFWDDLYRRNRSAISQLSSPKHSRFFSPYSPTSIAYRPLPRAELIVFLIEHGLWKAGPPETTKQKGFFANHILNLLYWSLNEAMYHDIPTHLSPLPQSILLTQRHPTPTHPHTHTHLSPFSPTHSIHSSPHTQEPTFSSAAGTDHDDSALRERPRFQWEEVYGHDRNEGVVGRVGSWVGGKMGVSRFVPARGGGGGWGGGGERRGVGLDLRRDEGRGEYVAI